MTEPFNLDAVLGVPFTFTFDGEDYTLPVDVEWEVSQMLGDGKPAEAIRALLGEDQWARLEASPKAFGTRSFTLLLDSYMEHLGLREGESVASSPSSENTAGPSKPTFNGTTESTSPTSDAPRQTVAV